MTESKPKTVKPKPKTWRDEAIAFLKEGTNEGDEKAIKLIADNMSTDDPYVIYEVIDKFPAALMRGKL